MRSVEFADTPQAAQHVRDVAAEHSAVRVQLIEHDVLQVLEQLHPLGVVGQDPGVEHVGVGYDHVSGAADRGSHRGRRVAVVGVGRQVDVHVSRLALQLGELVLRQGLRREDVQGTRGRILRDRVEDRQVVAEGLAGRGRRDDHGVATGARRFERRGLVRIELGDPAAAQCRGDASVEPLGERRVAGRTSRDTLPARDHLLELPVGREAVEDLLEAGAGGEANGCSHQARDDMERPFTRQ